MKVKEFLDNLDETILPKIEDFSIALNKSRTFVSYEVFEDIVYGESMENIRFNIKPITKSLPDYLMKRVS